MKKIHPLLVVVVLVVVNCKSPYADLGEGFFADIQTDKGKIIIKLEYKKAPVTTASFVSLAEGKSPFVSDDFKGKKYFDGLTFHRVIKDFMIQGGDPTAMGSGGPGYKFKDEFNDSLTHDKAGIMSMANPGTPNTNGSQFFITHKETPWLDNKHTIFGEVVRGMDVIDSIANVEVASGNKPVDDIIMNKVEIIRNGKSAKKFDAVKIMTDYFAEEEVKIATAKKVKEEFSANLAEQRKKAKTLASGIQIYSLKKGDGEQPKVGQKVSVYYAGYFEDGKLFDSNIEEIAKLFGKFDAKRKKEQGYKPSPMSFSPDARLIAGFKEGLLTMKVGDKIRLFIPSHLGYGAQGSGPIPANSNLIFDLEITEIVK